MALAYLVRLLERLAYSQDDDPIIVWVRDHVWLVLILEHVLVFRDPLLDILCHEIKRC